MKLKRLSQKHLISINDLTKQDIELIFKTTSLLKKKYHADTLHRKTLAMIFAKPSLRTRVSFAVGMEQLGGLALDIPISTKGFGERESIKDQAKVLSRFVDGIMARLFDHKDIIELAEYSDVPVINGLTDLLHPCQALADLYTISEKRPVKKIKLAFVGDGSSNVCHSLMHTCYKLGMKMSVACPADYRPNWQIMKNTDRFVEIFSDPKKAVRDAEVIYTDTWVSMGQNAEKAKRVKIFKPHQLNMNLLEKAQKNALVMHCLPAHRGYEITDDVIDSKQSIVYDQAENRLHVQKAIMALLMK